MGLFLKKKDTDKLPDAPDQIVTDEAFLRTPSVPTDLKHIEEINLVERIKRSLGIAWTGGFGLAAIQIGIPIQAAWYAMKLGNVTHTRLMWNPKIITARYPFVFEKEGCLSIPGYYFRTERFHHIKWMNGDGELIEANGIEAVIVQHEIAHMEGKLAPDFLLKPKPQVGRNDPCPVCAEKGIQIKYKKCADHYVS